LDRKVWLPSGGSLVIDRTEAMTVVDVNTGKFTGSGGNLEETVTKNNLEAAEEMVRQLRLRDIGGIIVIDFIDMVLESNRDLVLRRLVECLGRDRTRHQVAEVTSLGLVQMTRKRIGTGLVEAFSENCEHCNGRGVVISDLPVEPKRDQDAKRGARRTRGGRGGGEDSGQADGQNTPVAGKSPSPKDVAAMARTPRPDETDEVVEALAVEEATTVEEAITVEEAVAVESPEEQSAQEQPSEEQAQPAEKPVVKTTTRRSRSRRTPATEPAAPSAEPAAEQPRVIDERPVVAAEPAPTPEPTPEPVAPKVVTRTRGRSANRPAGPPATSAVPDSIGQPPRDGAVEPGTADSEPGTRPVVEHVPVKKRGARKR
ncbi:MAG: ribonuclease E/G, partial [Nocardioides sp.]